MFAFGAQDHHPGFTVGVYVCYRADQLLDDYVIKGVAFVWPVQHDFRHALGAAFEQNCRFLFCLC